eukprot:COSAG04_NODE_720_length_10812_cov_2.903108_3_plen_89_part_00
MMQPVPGVSAFPNGDNIFSWAATIEGSAGTVRSRQQRCCTTVAFRNADGAARAGVRGADVPAVGELLGEVPLRGPHRQVRDRLLPPER